MSPLRTHPELGLIKPCLPSPAPRPPSGSNWLHEIKHDGFRILARRDDAGVRLITRHGSDFTSRFPLAVEAVNALKAHSFLLDGEAIVTDDHNSGMRAAQQFGQCALAVLNGRAARHHRVRSSRTQSAPHRHRGAYGDFLNEVFEGDGDILFAHACKLGCEGIVSKRALSLRPFAALAQGQEPEGTCREA